MLSSPAWFFGYAYECRVCKHALSDHRHYNSRWAQEEQEQTTVDSEAKMQFDAAKSDKAAADILLQRIVSDQKKLQKQISDTTAELCELADRYAELSLSGSFLGQVEKAVKMLEQNLEAMQTRGASKETIAGVEQTLTKMKGRCEVLRTATRTKWQVAKQKFQDLSSSIPAMGFGRI